MLISVVIPNFNDLRIKRTLESIYSQTYKDFELIVIEGGNSSEVLDLYKSYPITTLVNEKDNGIFDALNKGVSLAKGDVIYLLGSDDYLPNINTFHEVISKFNSNSQLKGVCIGCEFINSSDKVIRKWYPNSITTNKIKLGIFPPHFSLFMKREIYSKVGLFQYKEFRNIACDIFWLLDMAILFPNIQIATLKNFCLKMEYGGSSTGSFKAIWNQFIFVHKYARRQSKHLPFWILLSPIRTFSKIFQFRL